MSRLIDADALVEELRDKLEEVLGLESQDASGLRLAIDIVEDTIEAEPVRHGTWLERADGRYGQWRTYCSVCGKHSGIGGIKQKPPYCPHCGAKMDGGGEA